MALQVEEDPLLITAGLIVNDKCLVGREARCRHRPFHSLVTFRDRCLPGPAMGCNGC